MQGLLQRAWLRRGPLACLLWPLSLAYRALAATRRAAYRSGVFASHHPGVPVVVVGNVIAGGSGKTPIVQAIARHLKAKGTQAGIISRGHGRATSGCREVRTDAKARDVGDEPLLLARTTGVPVFVAERRIDAARALRAAYPQTQVIVCDDGLQHLALARDIDICVFDARGTGNGWLLPAGPLREPWPRPVDFVLRAGHEVHRRLGDHGVRADGSRVPLESMKGRPFTAVAGIAGPAAFFAMLRACGLAPTAELALPDHHAFADDTPLPAGEIICTEKDAVKLWRTRPDALAIPLELEIDPGFWAAFDAKLSSLDGPQTA